MIDVRNLFLESRFKESKKEDLRKITAFIKIILNMTTAVPLKLIGKLDEDGSYPIAIIDRLKKTRLISIGVGNNIRFDESMASMGVQVWLYDHTVNLKIKKKYFSKMQFFKIGLHGKDKFPNCLTLTEIINQSGNANLYDHTILKIDCEGSEWDALLETNIDTLVEIDQICGEFHELDKIVDHEKSEKYLKVIQKLSEIFVISYIAVNNYTPMVKLDNGLNWPFTIELHLLNKKLLKDFKLTEIMPRLPSELGFKKSNWHLKENLNLENWYKERKL